MTELVRDQTWRERASCAQTDPEAFFPEKGVSSAEAKKVCAGCAVREECLADALRRDERFGVWGGTTQKERSRLRNEQAVKPPTAKQVRRMEREAAIIAMVGKGLDAPAIAAELHVSDQTVYRALTRHRRGDEEAISA